MPKPYTIITTIYRIGQICSPCEKEEVRTHCERFKRLHYIQNGDEHMYINVLNNDTGEIREYWNSTDNKIKF